MKVTVIKPFRYAADGIRSVLLPVGSEPDLPAGIVPGLRHEGFLAPEGEPLDITDEQRAGLPPLDPEGSNDPAGFVVGEAVSEAGEQIGETPPTTGTAETAEERAAVEIPADWRDLSYPKLRSLGSKLTDAPVHNKDEATAAIEAELKKRAG